LPLYQFPHLIALDGEQAIVVATDSGSPQAMGSSMYAQSFIVTRLSDQGAIANSQTFSYGADTPIPQAIVVDQAGEIQIATTIEQTGSTLNTLLELERLHADFSVDIDTRYAHTGTNSEAMSMSVAGNGDLLLAGFFDNQLDFGGTPLQSVSLGSYYAIIGFAARLKPDHTYVGAMQFGDQQFADGTAIVEQAGSVYLAGTVDSATTVGGVSVTGDANGSGFVAKMSTFGAADWVQMRAGASGIAALVAGQNRVIALTSYSSAPYVLQDVAAQTPVTFLTLTPSQGASGMLAAGGSSFWLSMSLAGTITVTPPGTVYSDSEGTLLLHFSQ
jgi:hypothetical protein